MKAISRMLSRLRGAWSGHKYDSDLAEELELHIEMQTEDNIRAGMTPAQARRAARLKFGGLEAIKENYRDQRGAPLIESLFADLRYAIRQLRRTPGFTLTAVVAIALGIGANTAIFSVMNTVSWKPLPIPEPDRLVVLTRTFMSDNGENSDNFSASPAEFAHWRRQSGVLDDVSAFLRTSVNYTGGDTVELWHAQRTSLDLFRAFRMPVLHGRTFTPEEDRPNGPHVAVISQGLWKRRFASDPQIVGKTVSLSGEPHTIVGIVGDTSGVLENGANLTDVYVPFQLDPDSRELGQTFTAVARLKPGATLQQARQQLGLSAAGFRAKFPRALGPKDSFSAKHYKELIFEGEGSSEMLVLFGAVGMVLLIACANVANLLLVRGANRKREIGIRIAIGAGRRRVIRQLLTECMLLSAAGGAIGLLLGDIGIRALIAANFTDTPPYWKFEIDWQVVAFAFSVSVITALIFGLLPALQSSRVDLNSALKDSGGRWGTGFRQNKVRSALVISEMSLAMILLVGSALLIRAFIALHNVDRGFETSNVLVMYSSLSGPKYTNTANTATTIRNGLERVRALPGVTAAGTAAYVPLQGNLGLNFNINGQEPADGSSTGGAGWVPVSADYFDVFKIPVKRGRALTERDDTKSAPVVVINESMAKKYWKDGDPLKDRITIGNDIGSSYDDAQVRQIVGIVGDVRQRSLSTAPEPRMYVPQAQLPDAVNAELVRLAPNAWIVRTQKDTHEISVTIQDQIRQATGLPVFEVRSMNQVLAGSIEFERFLTIVMTTFACLAVLLAAIGIYGVMSYTVQQRSQEIGIRIALGAEPNQVRNMVVRDGLSLTLAGVLIGIATAWELALLMQGLLFGVQPRDPFVFFSVPVVLSAVALFAVWRPATRASCVSPMESLRCE